MIGKVISHYTILEKLGEGGMGVVYKAEDTKLKRTVALKFLSSQSLGTQDEKTRFVHEAQAAAALDHPNICTVHEIDEADGHTFIAMAYVDGQSLREKTESGPLKLEEALSVATDVAQGLQEAHEKGIVHRDIKSANVMVTKKGQGKITDFGLAKLAGRTKVTKTGTSVGTVAYMSPEQARGEEVDQRTDIWSLGVVVYEMLAGQLPFRGDHEQAVTYQIVHEDPEPITALRTGVPMEMERIVDKAMAKKTDERYQHVSDFLVDLRLLKKKLESGGLKEPSTKERVGHRKRALLYGGVAILLALLVVGRLYFFTAKGEAINSVAVLPLENLSGDPEQDYFADGMTDALISDLAQIGALRVISRTSVMRYKETHKSLPEIARELNVDAIVEGTVLRAGVRVRITAQLIHAATDRHLWAANYERDLGDILALQAEVARAIAREIEVKLGPQEEAHLASVRTVDPKVHEAYLKGRYFWNKWEIDGLKKATEYFKQAIEIDPTYAPAYAGLAGVYSDLGSWGVIPTRESHPQAKAWAEKALELDERLAEAHVALASIIANLYWNRSEAEKHFKRAIELNPNYATAHQKYAEHLRWMGRFDEAIVEAKRAQALDPLSLPSSLVVGLSYYHARQYDNAIGELQETIEMHPDASFAYFTLGLFYMQKRMYEEGIAALDMARTFSGEPPDFVAVQGYAYAVAGKRSEALNCLHELQEISKKSYVIPFVFAVIFVGLGEKDKAFEYLEKAYEDRNWHLGMLKVEPIFDPLRSDPRFRELLMKVGLEE